MPTGTTMTSVTENTAFASRGATRGGRAYLARRSHQDEPADEHAPVAVRYEQFRTVDAFAARRFFAGAYQPGWRLTGLASGSAVSHRRWQARSVTLDEVAIEGRARCEVPAADSVLVIQPRAGSLTVADGPIPTADCPVLVAHGIVPCAEPARCPVRRGEHRGRRAA